jgi:hypothetical protein
MKNRFEKEQDRLDNGFFNFEGDNFYGNNYENFYGDQYNAGGNAPAAQQAPPSQPFNFSIVNSTASAVTAVILGANQNISATNNGNAAAITITQQNGSITYAQFLQNMLTYQFRVGLLYMYSTTAGQPFNPITVSQTDPTGPTSSLPYYPKLNGFQNQSTVGEVNCSIPVNAFTQFSISINASATLLFSLYPEVTLDVSQGLINQQPKQGRSNPMISGVPFQLLNNGGRRIN